MTLDSRPLTLPLPSRRVILLGASNLTRSFATIVEVVRRTWGEPVEIMAAMGHGRSYGQDSQVFGRKISGIFPCALWQDLQSRPPLPTAALITDVGNDLMYDVMPEQLLNWVGACVERLVNVGATTIVSELPLGSLDRLGAARFHFLRRLMFPSNRLTLKAAKSYAAAVNEGLVSLGRKEKTSVIPVSPSWYGFDAIHLKRRTWRVAWPIILASWREGREPLAIAHPPWSMRAYVTCLAPLERSFFGISRRAKQPSGVLADGSTISLY